MKKRKTGRSRKPRVYKDGISWRVQVGKQSYTFPTFAWAVQYAVAHYKNSSQNNWQAFPQTKGYRWELSYYQVLCCPPVKSA